MQLLSNTYLLPFSMHSAKSGRPRLIRVSDSLAMSAGAAVKCPANASCFVETIALTFDELKSPHSTLGWILTAASR